MQANLYEEQLFHFENYVNKIFNFVISNSDKYEAHEMENMIKKKVLELGKKYLELYFISKGTGDKGLQIETDLGIFKRERKLYKRDYYSIFGKVEVKRTCYKREGEDNIFPLDKETNLPKRSYSFVLQELMNLESLKHPYKDSSETLKKFLDLNLSTNALELVCKDSICEYEEFYETHTVKESSLPILTISFDGKGIPMNHSSSKDIIGRKNEVSSKTNKVRLGKGKRKTKKKEALAGVCYETDIKIRSAEEVGINLVFGKDKSKENDNSPKGQNIRRVASVEKSKKSVVKEIKNEVEKRDPGHNCIWSIIMDGAPYLWSLVLTIFNGVNIVPILDIIHVVEYLWDAGNALFGEGCKELGIWIYEKLVEILKGNVSKIIEELEEKSKNTKLSKGKIKQIERTIKYFNNHKEWMKYDEYLKRGLPIASGVVESTCGHLIKDRMEKSGCRWNIKGAETILKLRSIKTSNDWDEYWKYNIKQSKHKLYHFKIAA